MSFSFKNRLYARRCEFLLTQHDLARASGVSRQTINAIEQGRCTPSVYIALRIARVLDISVEWLFPLPKTF